jgi:AraC family transcriptional regulator
VAPLALDLRVLSIGSCGMSETTRIATGQFGRIAVLKLGAPIVEHAHPHAHVLIKLNGPDGLFEVDGVDCPLRDNTVVLVNPWAPHAAPASASSTVTNILALNIALEPDIDRKAAGRPARQKVFGERCRELDKPLRKIVDDFRLRMVADRVHESDVEEIFAAVNRRYRQDQSDESAPNFLDYRIRRAVGWLEEHSSQFDTDQCLEFAGLSRSRFYELFREETGISPRLYANALRLESAVNFLLTQTMPIKDIAQTLGFSTSGHFTRFFQHHTGTNPRDFRRGHCG